MERFFEQGYAEHMQAIRHHKYSSTYAQHILNAGHPSGNIKEYNSTYPNSQEM
jgi:hypothetical protein